MLDGVDGQGVGDQLYQGGTVGRDEHVVVTDPEGQPALGKDLLEGADQLQGKMLLIGQGGG